MLKLNRPHLNKNLGVIVCADDFGISSDVNEAILRLLNNRRISSVSCLVTGKAWGQGAILLKDFQGAVDIGLHLSYDEMPFDKILILACAKRLSKQLILKKFKFQLDCFMESMGRSPDYIDGHQHLHQLPVFRSALMDLIDTAGLNKFYIRNSAMDLNDILIRRVSMIKNLFIALPGSLLKNCLSIKEIPTNNDFLGTYDFNTAHDPGDILGQLLMTVRKENSILMCHPSCKNNSLSGGKNAFENKRVKEFRYLESDEYNEMLKRCGLYLTRFTYRQPIPADT